MLKVTYLLTMVLFLSSCLSQQQKETIKQNRIDNKEVKINYFSDKSLTPLEVPPDLTSPSYENAFRIQAFVEDIDLNVVNLSNTEKISEINQKILEVPARIEIKSAGTRKWLIVEKEPELVWDLAKQFLREQGFSLKKIDKKLGLIETNYLENKPDIPASSMGFIRSMLASQIDNVSYTLPSVDSYSLRIEPIKKGKSTEVYLSISSMAEVITNSGGQESTLWQFKERNISLETEMLYKLMIYLGSDSAEAREKILAAQKNSKISINQTIDINGFSKLLINFGIEEAWDNVSWAINNINLEVESKDVKEKSFYINAARSSDKGFFTKVFGDDAVRKIFRIYLRPKSKSETEVLFLDVSEENETETKQFSSEIMRLISDQLR